LKQITRKAISELLSQHLQYQVNVFEKRYLQVNVHPKKYFITYTSLQLPVQNISNVYTVGVPIIRVEPSTILLLPSIINCIQSNTFKVSRKDALKLTHGESIQVKEEHGLFVVLDDFDRRIAFGIAKNHVFVPISDVGSYIRDEKAFSYLQ
jgi:hypothetical protein